MCVCVCESKWVNFLVQPISLIWQRLKTAALSPRAAAAAVQSELPFTHLLKTVWEINQRQSKSRRYNSSRDAASSSSSFSGSNAGRPPTPPQNDPHTTKQLNPPFPPVAPLSYPPDAWRCCYLICNIGQKSLNIACNTLETSASTLTFTICDLFLFPQFTIKHCVGELLLLL